MFAKLLEIDTFALVILDPVLTITILDIEFDVEFTTEYAVGESVKGESDSITTVGLII